MTTIVNAAPLNIALGVHDLSTRALVPEREALPTHLPLIFGQFAWGPEEAQLVVGNSRNTMYGDDSFDERKKYCSHATILSNKINGLGNQHMIRRLIAADAAPRANMRLSLDVLETTITEYERFDDGSFKLDTAGAKIPTGATFPGYTAKWVLSHIGVDADGNSDFGLGTQGNGSQVDAATSAQSILYPVADFEVPHIGALGNLMGLRIWAPTTKSAQPLDQRVVQREKLYPFRLACIRAADANSTPRVIPTNYGEQFIDLSWKPGAINHIVDKEIYLGTQFIDQYQSLINEDGTPPRWGAFGRVHVYDDQVSDLLEMFYAAEKAHELADFTDFDGSEEEHYRFNFMGGTYSNAVPYQTFQLISSGTGVVRLTEKSNHFAMGGSDGSVSEATLDELVRQVMDDYADLNNEVQDEVKYPFSCFWDSGYSLETKYALCKFLACRKDVAVFLATHDVLGNVLTASEDSSLAVALRTRLQNYPESEYYGTSTLRGMVVGRSGTLLRSKYSKKLPLTIELAMKSARYMGASTGKWDPVEAFDQDPTNVLTEMKDISVAWTPAAVRNKDWANGLVYVERYQRNSFYFSAVHTVYDNDTSVLTSFFTMMACVELQKVGQRAHRHMSGNSKLTNAQFAERLNQFVTDNTTGRFDDRFVIIPETVFTEADLARGYSWNLKIKIYAPNMKTVQVLTIEAYRIEDLETA